MRFEVAKTSLQNNIVSYVEEILLSLYSRFGALTEDDAEEWCSFHLRQSAAGCLFNIRHEKLDPFREYDC